MSKFVESIIGVMLPEPIAREIEEIYKSIPSDCKQLITKSYTPLYQFEPGERAEVSIISSITPDYSNEVVLPDGVDLDKYRSHMRVLWNHNRNQPPIAKCLWLKAYKDTIRAKTVYPEKVDKAVEDEWFVDSIWDMVRSGLLPGKSISFLPVKPKRDPLPEELETHPEWKGCGVWDDVVMVEYSVVPIGCNPSAIVEYVNTKSLSLDKFSALGFSLPEVQKAVEPTPEPIPEVTPEIATVEEKAIPWIEVVDKHIVKLPSGKYRLLSKKGGKNLGTFDSLEAAKKHEAQVEYFKQEKKKVNVLDEIVKRLNIDIDKAVQEAINNYKNRGRA